MKKNQEKFNEDIKLKYKDLYEVLGEYNDRHTKIKIKCKVCGEERETKPCIILSKKGIKCSCEKSLKYNIKDVINDMENKYKNEYKVIGNFVNKTTKVKIKHLICGYEYMIKPTNFMQGRKCPNCSSSKQRTNEEFKREIYEIYKDEYECLSEYKNNKTKVKMKHNVCGHVYEVVPSHFINNKTKCPRCYGNNVKTLQEVKDELYKKYKEEYTVLSDTYINLKVKIKVRHNTCGHEYEVLPNNLLNKNRRCPKCYGTFKKTTEEYKKEIYLLYGNEYEILDDYINCKTKIKIRHNPCGNEYYITPTDLIQGSGCPNCYKISKGEKLIIDILKNTNVSFKKEYTFDDLSFINKLRFDFGILDNNNNLLGLIEYDGEGHYRPINYNGISDEEVLNNFEKLKLRDNIKNKYCEENSIKLIRIPYYSIKNIKNLVESFIKDIVLTT